MRRTFPLWMTLAIAAALVATACSKSTPTATGAPPTSPAVSSPSGSSSGGGTIPIGDDTANDHGTKDVTGASTVTVEQHNDTTSGYFFSPTVLSGSAGQTLTVHLENKGTLPHTFTIDAQNVSVQLSPGGEQDVQVTMPTSGTVEFYCQFHHSSGMAGELTVG
jgi:plastocyanin